MTEAADRIIDFYERNAHQWDTGRGRGLFEKPWLDRFLALLPPGGTILDLGCGSAEPIADYLIGQGFAVTGVDASPSMIALSEGRFPNQGWILADMRRLSLNRRFQGVLAWNSFFHLGHDDQRRMFEVFRRHGVSGTALMFTSGPGYGEAIGRFLGEPLYHASLDGAEYRALLDAHGFDVVAQVNEDPDCNQHTVWLARAR